MKKILNSLIFFMIMVPSISLSFTVDERSKGFISLYAGYDFAWYTNTVDSYSYDPFHFLNINGWVGLGPFIYNITYRTDRGWTWGEGKGDKSPSDYINNNLIISLGNYQDGLYVNYTYALFNAFSIENPELTKKFTYQVIGGGFKATELAGLLLSKFFDNIEGIVSNMEKIGGVKGYVGYRCTILPNMGTYHMGGVTFLTTPPKKKLHLNFEAGAYIGIMQEDWFHMAYVIDVKIGLGYRGDFWGYNFSIVFNMYDFGDLSSMKYDSDAGQIYVGDGLIDAMFIGIQGQICLDF